MRATNSKAKKPSERIPGGFFYGRREMLKISGTKKEVAYLTINYKDGTRETLDDYALVGLSGETWFSLLHAELSEDDMVELNNHIADLTYKIRDFLDKKK